MNWTVEYDEALQIIVSNFVGKCTGHDFKAAVDKRFALARKTGSRRALIDVSKVETDEFTTIDTYEIVTKMYYDFGSQEEWKIALITPYSSTSKRQTNFFKTVCTYRGWEIMEFAERKNAIEWLIKDSSS